MGALHTLWRSWTRLSEWVVTTSWVVWLLAVVNLASAVAGYLYWYGDAILAAPVYFWPFVPDSPLSCTLVAIALLLFHYRGRDDLLTQLVGLLAAVGCIKYGLWTDWVWLVNSLTGGSYTFEAVHLSLSHFGMVLEGLALVPLLRPRAWMVAAVVGWYALNDLVDYGLGYQPRLPDPADLSAIRSFAVASTVVLAAAAVALAWCVGRGGEATRGPVG